MCTKEGGGVRRVNVPIRSMWENNFLKAPVLHTDKRDLNNHKNTILQAAFLTCCLDFWTSKKCGLITWKRKNNDNGSLGCLTLFWVQLWYTLNTNVFWFVHMGVHAACVNLFYNGVGHRCDFLIQRLLPCVWTWMLIISVLDCGDWLCICSVHLSILDHCVVQNWTRVSFRTTLRDLLNYWVVRRVNVPIGSMWEAKSSMFLSCTPTNKKYILIRILICKPLF